MVEWTQHPSVNGMMSVCLAWRTHQAVPWFWSCSAHRSNPSWLVVPSMFWLQKYESQEHHRNLFNSVPSQSERHLPIQLLLPRQLFLLTLQLPRLCIKGYTTNQNMHIYVYIELLAKYGKVLHTPITRISYPGNETLTPVHLELLAQAAHAALLIFQPRIKRSTCHVEGICCG